MNIATRQQNFYMLPRTVVIQKYARDHSLFELEIYDDYRE